MTLYTHVPHPHIAARNVSGPARTVDQLDRSTAVARINASLAVLITRLVGSMWCTYLFAAFDLLSLPAAIRGGIQPIVSWSRKPSFSSSCSQSSWSDRTCRRAQPTSARRTRTRMPRRCCTRPSRSRLTSRHKTPSSKLSSTTWRQRLRQRRRKSEFAPRCDHPPIGGAATRRATTQPRVEAGSAFDPVRHDGFRPRLAPSARNARRLSASLGFGTRVSRSSEPEAETWSNRQTRAGTPAAVKPGASRSRVGRNRRGAAALTPRARHPARARWKGRGRPRRNRS
jgi:hypothetical protein